MGVWGKQYQGWGRRVGASSSGAGVLGKRQLEVGWIGQANNREGGRGDQLQGRGDNGSNNKRGKNNNDGGSNNDGRTNEDRRTSNIEGEQTTMTGEQATTVVGQATTGEVTMTGEAAANWGSNKEGTSIQGRAMEGYTPSLELGP
ncbi:hypothetical protein NDU88_007915 [Pleurodeles waltl]|uniref:Uncharacterized protein n=1 Tax=Pleurodeles waltl TaxID=8319 RepID=A0AAV7PQE2_PLEWA|nr:hypothetical protein NDU88_007915 [Pleurodeles waltl]